MRFSSELIGVIALSAMSFSQAFATDCSVPKTKNEAFGIVEKLLKTNREMKDAARLSSKFTFRYISEVRTEDELQRAQKMFDDESGPYRRGAEFGLAMAYARMGDESKAEAYLTPEREASERSAIAIPLAKFYVGQGRHEDARAIVNRMVDAGKRRVLIGNIVSEQIKAKEIAEVGPTLELLKPDETIVVNGVVKALADAGYVDEAAELFTSYNISQRNYSSVFVIITAYARAGRDAEAEAFAAPAISHYKDIVANRGSPDYAGRHIINGQLLRLIDQGELDRAEQEINRLYEREEQIDRTKPNAPPKLTPTEARYALRAARIEEAIARNDFASALLEGKKRPKLDRSLTRIAEAATKSGRLDTAFAVLELISEGTGARRGARSNMARWVLAGEAPEKYCELIGLMPAHVQTEVVMTLAPSLP